MPIPKQTFFRYIKDFKLKELFNELGWDNATIKHLVKVDDKIYNLTSIAQKKDFVIFLCTPDGSDGIPDSSVRKKIDNAITKLHFEHLIIYIDGKKTRQHWELVIREQNKPLVSRPIDWHTGQEPELLFQKLEGLFFTFEDEEKLSIVDVRSLVMAKFDKNAEVVTKKFYERFEKEHDKFIRFIEGIESVVDKEWYASLMLNRLMFIYFIQKKGFVDNNKDYLQSKLILVQQKKGKNKFYSFYRDFLLILFHKGLGSPLHDKKFEEEFGRVPYLNGGLFDEHKLEKDNTKITIEDKAFEHIFKFFDEYNWHLDTRITATGKDINPDVIGYIFEKYINDRAAMGAYYTKEDITEYISKNCIVPWLFDEVKRSYAKPFAPVVTASEDPKGQAKQSDSSKKDEIASVSRQVGIPRNDKTMNIWSFLQQSGDKYIYPAVKYGIPKNGDLFTDLPEEVKKGFNSELEKKVVDDSGSHLFEIRKSWNKPAPSDIALPTEIYREVIARRKRYYEVRHKIQAGEITEINDFITYNLDIRQLAQDVLTESDDPKLIMEFYKAVRKITVLDPTCGSGAFLFAALNVLEDLYEGCVNRMRDFVGDDGKGKHDFFEKQLALIDTDDHPSERYFIYKSIILHNLYGVDIMKEAVEIAKLRLFLKLVATCDVDYNKDNLGLEPLPDIDFNIRSGNTLVGYATLADLDKSAQGGLFGSKEKDAILEQADVVSRAYARFKDSQLVMHTNPKSYKDAKDELVNRLGVLNERLNNHLAVTYLGENHSKKAYESWLASHQPFHWLAEYYTTVAQGGFDVIIGNPPYVEYADINYKIIDYKTQSCSNLYAFILERMKFIISSSGRASMIVPLSGHSTDRMTPLIKFFYENFCGKYLFNISSDANPSKLFPEVKFRLVIFIVDNQQDGTYTTKYKRWYSEERDRLFEMISYTLIPKARFDFIIPKFSAQIHFDVFQKIMQVKSNFTSERGSSAAYYHNAPVNWIRAHTFIPYFESERDGVKTSTQLKHMLFNSLDVAFVASGVFSSTLFYLWWITISDCYHLNKPEIETFPIDLLSLSQDDKIVKISKSLEKDLLKKSVRRVYNYKTSGRVEYDEFYLKKSKPIIDEIDKVLAKHYGFTEEELDFIINYDIKYRMGKELEE